ncbi:hypothetical protein DFA_09209 [Cavenderia fasciculata]|uniref:Uncharacterized protein n=1 Tax=Cavenderia fasciculata TaxID=261658 RepID=F4Q6Z9_CACFS|nr:uncharacterized protein DFA_09209 [Cavenderia fasciculata]EGG16181.1 hypothetical protein DFA_09209 [Cavenderia fasciculata]|eukprot:XP_004354565.1 hypothetical protein DFA_09209 [Cavenderia fasciculata]
MNNNNNSTSSSLSRSLLDSDLDPYSPGYHNNNNNNNNNNNSQQQQQQQQPNQPPQLQQQQQQQQSIPIPPQHHGANHQQSIEEMFDKIDLFGDIGGGSGLDTPKQQQQSTSQSSKTINNNNLLDLSGFEQILSINNNSNNNNNNRNNRNDEKDEEIRFKEKIFNSNRLDSLIEQLKETTLIHGEIQSEKAINENNIRSLYRQLWIVADDVQTLSETCPCGSTVNHVVKNQVSRLNIDIAKQLETLLTQNHHYNTSQFVGSLFSQSLNELRVLIYLYRFVCRDLENSNNNNNNDLIDDLSDASDTDTSATSAAKLLNTETIILDKLVTAYSSSDNTTVPSPPILSLLCQLTLKLKSKLDTYSISASKQQQSSSTHGLDGSGNLIDTIDFEDDILTSTTTPQSLLQQESVKRYNKIIADVTFNFKQEFVAWGYILIQPTIEDVFQRDWLLKLFHIPDVLAANQAGVTPNIKYLSEQSYINLVSQLDFKNRFARLTTYQNLNVHDKILYPLQKALELSISLKMMQLSQTICKILAMKVKNVWGYYSRVWIKLLKVNLFDEENLTILNYLACGSYLKNYGNEMIRELESSSVSNHDIKAMTKSLERRPWICYMILMAHIHTQKKSMSQPKLKDCLVLIKEMAIDLKTNAISLIFWEQFWVLYFELLMTNQTDPMSQDTKNNLYSTISLYMNKYPMTPPIKKIFETFTTWNKHTILSYNGEKFITPSNEELYKIFITNALWVFAKNEDKLNQERNQKHWLSGFSKIIDPKVLCDQLPMIKPATASDFSLEVKKYKNFIEILTTTSKNLSNGHRHSNSGEFEGIRLFNDLKLYIGHSKRLSNDILNDDKVFLDLSQNLHTTTTSKQNVLLRCTNVCIGVTSQYDQKISKPNTHIQMEIQENRKKFNQNFYSLFERIYQLSLLACVVEDEHLLTMFKGREIDLFKHLVDLVQDNHTDSIVSKLICTIREIAIDIGREILTKDPSNQQFLVDYFFKKDPKNGTTSGDFSIFISLFSPSNITNINTYLDVLEDCVRFNGISNKEKREIIDLFKLENRIQQLFTCPSGKDRLVNLLPYFITLPMMESTIVLINSLLFIDSSHLINITLMMVKYKASFELMEKVFGKSKPFYEFLKSLGHSDQQNLIIQTIIELMTDTKSVSALFLLGNIISYDFLNRPFLQSLLTKIRLIYIQAIRPIDNATSPSQHSQPYVLNNTEFKLSLDFFVDLTLLIPRAVNMLWEVFYYGYMPLLDQMETHGSSGVADRHTQELVELIGNLAIGGHMNVATFHIQSADVLEQMCHVICQTIYSDIVVAIFSIVDWNLLFSMEKIPDVVALHYLKLSIYMSIMNGRSVSAPETGLALASEGVSLDWYKCGDLSEASVVFDGSTFTSIIASPTLKLNPSQSIVEALTLFKEITLYLDNYSLAIALTLEIRSLLYFIAQSFDHSSCMSKKKEKRKKKKKNWYLPFVDQLNLVQNLLLPLIRSLAENKAAKDQEQSGIQQRMKSILKITMSCLEFSQHLPKTDCPLFYGSLTTVDEQGHLDSYNKIQRIMMAFCSSLSMNLCLQIMPIAHIVLHGTNYCQVMESVLHSFFTDDTIPVSTLINKYLVFTDPHLIIEKSIQNGCPLLFNPLTSLFSKNKAVLPQTHLASRACCVFLQRSILQQIGKSKEDESLLNTTSDSLMEMKKKSSPTFSSGAGGGSATQYHAFNQFFEQAENFLSPIVEIDDFSQILVQTLIPFASYLLNLLNPFSIDLRLYWSVPRLHRLLT